MEQDTLSEVLRSIRLRGTVFFHLQGRAPWVVESPPTSEIASAVIPGAEHVMAYHVVTRGSCWVGVVGEQPVLVREGDIVVFPHGDRHVLSSTPHMRARQAVDPHLFPARIGPPFFVDVHGDQPTLVAPEAGGGSGRAVLVCGFLGCDVRPFNPLIASLPRLLIERAGQGSPDGWLAQFVRSCGAGEGKLRPGDGAVLERMSEMMVLDLVRRHLERLPETQGGWLGGLRDRFVGRALALMHAHPDRAWTIDRLADETGLSRSALHERFVQFTGQAPMQYLAGWRMQRASGLLRQSDADVTSIALEVGYESVAAFSRAFKRATGLAPTAWRKDAAANRPGPG